MSNFLNIFNQKQKQLEILIRKKRIYYKIKGEILHNDFSSLEEMKRLIVEIIKENNINYVVLLVTHVKICKKRDICIEKRISDFFYKEFKNKVKYDIFDTRDLFFGTTYKTPMYVEYNEEFYHQLEEIVTPIPKKGLSYTKIETIDDFKKILGISESFNYELP